MRKRQSSQCEVPVFPADSTRFTSTRALQRDMQSQSSLALLRVARQELLCEEERYEMLLVSFPSARHGCFSLLVSPSSNGAEGLATNSPAVLFRHPL
jgi:hypothetical protein